MVVYKQHMVPSLSIRVLVVCSIQYSGSSTETLGFPAIKSPAIM